MLCVINSGADLSHELVVITEDLAVRVIGMFIIERQVSSWFIEMTAWQHLSPLRESSVQSMDEIGSAASSCRMELSEAVISL